MVTGGVADSCRAVRGRMRGGEGVEPFDKELDDNEVLALVKFPSMV